MKISTSQAFERYRRENVNHFRPDGSRDAAIFPDTNMRARPHHTLGDLADRQLINNQCVRHDSCVTTSYANPASKKLHMVTGVRVTSGNMDSLLHTLREPHERLRWARVRWQTAKGIKPDQKAAAESLGIHPHTYRAYERPPGSSKSTLLSHQRAIQFARKYGVSWEWLMTGAGTPDTANLSELTPTERRVIDALREAPEARQTAVADAIEQLLKSA